MATGKRRVSSSPNPRRPASFQPQPKTRPSAAQHTECSEPHAALRTTTCARHAKGRRVDGRADDWPADGQPLAQALESAAEGG